MDAAENNGATALHHALSECTPTAVRVLLEAGAALNTPPGDGTVPSILWLAIRNPIDPAAVRAILLRGAELHDHEDVPVCPRPEVAQYLHGKYRRRNLVDLSEICFGTHPRVGAASPVSVLAGFPQITEFIVRHALPRVARTDRDEVELF